MFFIKIGSVLAWILVVFGLMRVAMGLVIAFGTNADNYAAATKRYLGSTSSGEAIDRGAMVLVAGVVIGLLVQIAKNHGDK